MPSKVPKSNNLRFSRTFEGMRITNSSGTPSKVEFRRRDAILTKLIEGRHRETLRLFKLGRLNMTDLLEADRRGTLSTVSEQILMLRVLAVEVEAWLPESAPAKASRQRYEVSWKHFLRVLPKANVNVSISVHDLATLPWRRIRDRWGTSGADWNRFRAMLSAFLSDFLGHSKHAFRLEVMGQLPKGEESAGVVPDLPVPVFWEIVKDAHADEAATFVALAVLGAGPAELRRARISSIPGETEGNGTVAVPGTKKGRQGEREVVVDRRFWFYVVDALVAKVPYKRLRKVWIAACKVAGVTGVTMYALRHLHAQLAADANVPERDIGEALGHRSVSTTRRYTRRRRVEKVAKAVADALGGQPQEEPPIGVQA